MAIEFRHVSKTFPDGTTAVEDFSLTIPSHETTVFVGSSGCGKTTLLRMINRMVDPTSGSILIDGKDISEIPPVGLRRSIGYVMQNSGLLPHRTVADNVATVPMLTGVPKRKAREDALGLLDRVGLDRSLAGRYPAQLSGGQQQRVGVARGLAVDPNILLMDEPFGAVDPIVRDELQQELLRLQGTLGKTVVFVTHDIDEAFLLGNQVVILQRGGRDRAGRHPQGHPRQPGERLRRRLHRREARQAPPHGRARRRRRGAARRRRRLRRRRHHRARRPPGARRHRTQVPQRLEQDGPGGRRLMDWVWSHLAEIGGLTLDHIALAVPPIVLGFLVSIPLGYWASRSGAARGVLLTVGNILYTIPALALVVLVPVLLGLSLLNPLNVIVALLIYAVALMVRSAADAFAAVSDDVRQSATAQGYSGSQRFFRVELPLAGPGAARRHPGRLRQHDQPRRPSVRSSASRASAASSPTRTSATSSSRPRSDSSWSSCSRRCST